MTTELIVKLAPSAEPERVRAHADGLGLRLVPLHPGTRDPELAAYLVARVDPGTADDMAHRMMRVEGVDGAYAKPPAAAP